MSHCVQHVYFENTCTCQRAVNGNIVVKPNIIVSNTHSTLVIKTQMFKRKTKTFELQDQDSYSPWVDFW